MEQLNWDTIGPLPEDTSGNKYILVVIDCFTRSVELYAILNAAIALLKNIGRYGAPYIIKSDRGVQFNNDLIKEITNLVGTAML